MNRSANPEIDELIASGRKLAREATELLEEVQQFFADHNITPESAMEEVRKRGGEDAVRKVLAQVDEETRKIEEEVAMRKLHMTKKRPAGRRASGRMMI
ncbi:MAG: hypothetical protein EOO28_16370 [Comamonadaceae bacterium]|nr:MAG: hypothetical protein EOO28_16370 [Comamonadaceae bacterium]